MKIKTFQYTTTVTPKSFSSYSTVKMRTQNRQKFTTEPASPDKMRRTNLRSFHELSVKRNKGFSKNLKSFDKIKTEQLLDEKFLKLIEDIKSNNGFRGALNTNSRNQLLYLQPKRRYQNKGKSLGDIKESLYRGIYNQNNREEIDEDAMQNKMINYLTQYDPSISEPMKMNPQKKHGLLKAKNNSIREKLRSVQRESGYSQKVKNYTRLFNNMKIQ